MEENKTYFLETNMDIELIDLKNQKNILTRRVNELEEEVYELQTVNHNLSKTIQMLQNDNDKLSKRVSEYSESTRDWEEKMKEITNLMNSFEADNSQLQIENKQLKLKYDTMQGETSSRYEREFYNFETIIQRLDKRIEDTLNENKALKERINRYENEIRQLKNESVRKNEEMIRRETVIIADLNEHKKEIKRLEERLTNMKHNHRGLDKQIHILQKEIAELRNIKTTCSKLINEINFV